MSDQVVPPEQAMGGLSLYSQDVDIPDYVSSGQGSVAGSAVGSSVSQSKENTVEVNAAMFHNAMNKLMTLESQVFYFHLFLLVFKYLMV
jgi:hypothetical protein